MNKRISQNYLGIIAPFVWGVLLTCSTTAALASTTYYVDVNNSNASDTNPGSQALPWKTIGKASTTMAAGDTSIIVAGTYNEGISTQRDGASGSRITFKAAGVANISGVNINHSYITIDGFTIKNMEIGITNGNYCEVLNNHVSGGAIHFNYQYSPTGCLIKGNHLDAVVSPSGDAPQIEIFGTNHIVDSNEIGPSSDIDAFRIWGHNHIIRNNYIHDITYSPGSLAHMDGFQTFGDNGWESYNITIENNKFINSQGQLFNTSQDNVTGIHDYIVRNNVFAHFGQNANFGLPNFYFYNNTLYDTGILYLVTGGSGQPFNATNVVVTNNILIGVGGCSNNQLDNVYNNPSNLLLTRSNNFYSTCTGAPMIDFNQTPLRDPTGINGGTINFTSVSTNDFTLKSPSPAIDAGVTLSGFNYDLSGTVRPQGSAWDVGAFEYFVSGGTPQLQTNILQPPSNLTAK
ncbi:MAG: choice-of-anchor Q domain-containing protein [Methylobacter sp.]